MMIYFILLIAGNIIAVTSGFSLNCTNDRKTVISCYMDADNCTRLSMTLNRTNNLKGTSMKGTCKFKPCDRGCCCITQFLFVVLGDSFLATLHEDEQRVHYHNINIIETYKPPAPHISVKHIHGKPQIQWCSSPKDFIQNLKAIVTYWENGSDKKTSEYRNVRKNATNANCNEIDDLGLESNTAYVASVKVYADYGVLSDSSNEVDFTTESKEKSTNVELIILILCLSVAAIALSATGFVLAIRLKGELWDKPVKEERPKLLDFQPNKKVILTPESLFVYSLSVEPLVPKNSLSMSKESLSDSSSRHSSGISTAPLSLDYPITQADDIGDLVLQALRSALPNFTPVTFSSYEPAEGWASPTPLEDTSSPVFFHNKSYISTSQTDRNDGVDRQMTCDAGYDSSDGHTLQDFTAPPHVSVAMETVMSYQPSPLAGEASGGPQSLPVIYGYQLVEQCNNTSSTEETGKCLTQGVSDDVPSVCRVLTVDPGYHCV